MRGIRGDRCTSCRRSFSGSSTWEKHFIGQGDNRRCRTVKELRRNGLVRRPDGIWTRRYLPRQLRLIVPRGRPVRGVKYVAGGEPQPRGRQAREANPALTEREPLGAA